MRLDHTERWTYCLFFLVPQLSPLRQRIDNIPRTTLLASLILFHPAGHIPIPCQCLQPCADHAQIADLVLVKTGDLELVPTSDGVSKGSSEFVFEFEDLGAVSVREGGAVEHEEDGIDGLGENFGGRVGGKLFGDVAPEASVSLSDGKERN